LFLTSVVSFTAHLLTCRVEIWFYSGVLVIGCLAVFMLTYIFILPLVGIEPGDLALSI